MTEEGKPAHDRYPYHRKPERHATDGRWGVKSLMDRADPRPVQGSPCEWKKNVEEEEEEAAETEKVVVSIRRVACIENTR